MMHDESVRQRLREHGAAAHVVAAGSDGLLHAWRAFVDRVAHGYSFGIEDYRNDLDIRSLIAVAGLDAEARADDDRLRPLLTTTHRAIWSSDTPRAWWVNGYPANASGQLLADLRAAGIAP